MLDTRFFSGMVKKTELSHQGQKNGIVRTGRMGAFFSPNSSNARVVKNICIQKFSLETFWFTNPLCMYGERIRNSFPGRSRSWRNSLKVLNKIVTFCCSFECRLGRNLLYTGSVISDHWPKTQVSYESSQMRWWENGWTFFQAANSATTRTALRWKVIRACLY